MAASVGRLGSASFQSSLALGAPFLRPGLAVSLEIIAHQHLASGERRRENSGFSDQGLWGTSCVSRTLRQGLEGACACCPGDTDFQDLEILLPAEYIAVLPVLCTGPRWRTG